MDLIKRLTEAYDDSIDKALDYFKKMPEPKDILDKSILRTTIDNAKKHLEKIKKLRPGFDSLIMNKQIKNLEKELETR